MIANNATGKGSAATGTVRRGELLLAGFYAVVIAAAKCMSGYGGKAGRYYCHGALVNHGTERCISFRSPCYRGGGAHRACKCGR